MPLAGEPVWSAPKVKDVNFHTRPISGAQPKPQKSARDPLNPGRLVHKGWAPHVFMHLVVKCDRCGRKLHGTIEPGGTTGFYWIREGSQWARYCSSHEEVVCEACMWGHPSYLIDFGPRANHLN